MAAYERNTGRPHPLVGGIVTSSKRDTGSVSLTDNSNFMWYGTISIGSPPKTFTGATLFPPVQIWPSDLVLYIVDFDTGSSDLFVPSMDCTSCSGHNMYDTFASSTSRDLGKTFGLTYGDGSTVAGEQYSDVVILAGLVVRELSFLFFRYKALTLLTIGGKSDDRRSKTVLHRVSSQPFPGRRPDGHGFPVHIGLRRTTSSPKSYL